MQGNLTAANFTNRNLQQQNKMPDNYWKNIQGEYEIKSRFLTRQRKDNKTNNKVVTSLEL